MVQSYSCTDTGRALNKYCFILSEILDFYMVDNLSAVVHALPMRILQSLSVDDILLPRYTN